MWKNKLAILGAGILALLMLTAMFAPFIAPYDPLEQKIIEGLTPPSHAHWFGQDQLGRDIFSRVIYGSRISIWVGVATVSLSLAIGMAVGAISGYYGGFVDELFMRIVDILMAFPGILLAIAMVAILGPGLNHVILALCIIGWVGYARLVRGQVLYLRELDYVTAAQAIGATPARIIAFHLLPNLIAPLIVEATFGMAGAILAEASLSFLGLGAQPPTPSWGAILNDGRDYLLFAPHHTTFPGLVMMVVILGLNFLGDGCGIILMSRSRKQQEREISISPSNQDFTLRLFLPSTPLSVTGQAAASGVSGSSAPSSCSACAKSLKINSTRSKSCARIISLTPRKKASSGRTPPASSEATNDSTLFAASTLWSRSASARVKYVLTVTKCSYSYSSSSVSDNSSTNGVWQSKHSLTPSTYSLLHFGQNI